MGSMGGEKNPGFFPPLQILIPISFKSAQGDKKTNKIKKQNIITFISFVKIFWISLYNFH